MRNDRTARPALRRTVYAPNQRRLNRRARLVEVVSGALLIVMGLLVFGNVLQLLSAYFYRWFGYYL